MVWAKLETWDTSFSRGASSICAYPDQLGAWTAVHVGKWSSWSLLVVMTSTIVANLKHLKERVHVPS